MNKVYKIWKMKKFTLCMEVGKVRELKIVKVEVWLNINFLYLSVWFKLYELQALISGIFQFSMVELIADQEVVCILYL